MAAAPLPLPWLKPRQTQMIRRLAPKPQEWGPPKNFVRTQLRATRPFGPINRARQQSNCSTTHKVLPMPADQAMDISTRSRIAYMAKPTRPRREGRARSGASRLYAALDLGTNNCRLLIAERSASGGLRVVDSFSQIVRLGEGLAKTGQLSEKAQGRAIDALRRCVEKVKKHQPVEARYIATQACRAAANGKAFLNEVHRKLGLRMETITPKEEAKYALLGSLDLVDPSHDFALVIDIGGGSTELCWIDAKTAVARGIEGCAIRPPILGWASFPVGVVTLAESFEDRSEGWYPRMVEHVRQLLLANDGA